MMWCKLSNVASNLTPLKKGLN